MANRLSDSDIQSRLASLPDWQRQGDKIQCTKTFNGFVEAIAFVNKIVEPAETAGHHPDLTISYNKVTIALTTHDAGGLTDQDFAMAQTLSKLS